MVVVVVVARGTDIVVVDDVNLECRAFRAHYYCSCTAPSPATFLTFRALPVFLALQLPLIAGTCSHRQNGHADRPPMRNAGSRTGPEALRHQGLMTAGPGGAGRGTGLVFSVLGFRALKHRSPETENLRIQLLGPNARS